MTLNNECLKEYILQDSSNDNTCTLLNIICKQLQNICTLTYQISDPKIQVKKIKKNCIKYKKQKTRSKTSKQDLNVKKNQCFCQTCQDLQFTEYLSQWITVEGLQCQLEKVKELIYLLN